jgi:hypothetical protein
MQTAWTVVAQLVPALMAQPAPSRDTTIILPTTTVEAPQPFIGVSAIDWGVLRNDARAATLDTARARPRVKAVEYSGFYRARLKVHRVLSYTMIPLFIGSYLTGDQILKHRVDHTDPPKWASDLHRPFAIATGSVFAVNTVTGLWNLWDSRKNPVGQTKRTIHSLLFIAATAGFTYAGTSLAHDAKNNEDPHHFHRTVAVASMGVSLLSWGMMIFLK